MVAIIKAEATEESSSSLFTTEVRGLEMVRELVKDVRGLVTVREEIGLERVKEVPELDLSSTTREREADGATALLREGVREADEPDPEAGVREGVREADTTARLREGVREADEPDPEAGVREALREGQVWGSKGASQNNSVCLMEPEPNLLGALSWAE